MADPGDGIVRLHLERKGRKGKGVTLIRGLPPGKDATLKLAKQLKSACGVGGAVKDGVIELQSIDRDKIRGLLEAQGHRVKLAGG
ncbi:MAG: translation initiation factor [Pseudomonadales bacterium]